MCKTNGKWLALKQTCGSVRAIPTSCGDPLCIDCERQKSRERQNAWLPVVENMKRARMMTLTMKSDMDLASAWSSFNNAFRKFMDLALGTRNCAQLKTDAVTWQVAHLEKLYNQGDITSIERHERETAALTSIDRFFRDIEKRHRQCGKTERIRDVVGPGFISREVTFSFAGWHVHGHAVTDGQYIPHPVLVASWIYATRGAGQVVDIRALNTHTAEGVRKSMREVIKYLTKMWEIPADKTDEFRLVIRGKQRIKPLGGAKPAEPETVCPCCGEKTCRAEFIGQGTELHSETTGDGKQVMILECELIDPGTGMLVNRPLVFQHGPTGWLAVDPSSLISIHRELAPHSDHEPPPPGRAPGAGERKW